MASFLIIGITDERRVIDRAAILHSNDSHEIPLALEYIHTDRLCFGGEQLAKHPRVSHAEPRMNKPQFQSATERYERWLREQTPIIDRDLRSKYRKMRKEGVFTFFRGTFYRWVDLWEGKRKELRENGVLIRKAPEILSVGDLHIENFGTWRDAEGRLVWGINDFDEAYPLRYLNDLVRLATSAFFAIQEVRADWSLSHEKACDAILKGYREGHASGGAPFALTRCTPWLWNIATNPSRTPEQFWEKIRERTRGAGGKHLGKILKEARKALDHSAPEDPTAVPTDLRLRQAGVGSLGRPRFVQFYEGRAGQILREAKRIAPSAAVFAGFGPVIKQPYQKLLHKAVRLSDPFFIVAGNWTVRRLAFDSDKIPLESLKTVQDATAFFQAMGTETANIHLGGGKARAVEKHLEAQSRHAPDWLIQASSAMAGITKQDFDDFCVTKLGIEKKM